MSTCMSRGPGHGVEPQASHTSWPLSAAPVGWGDVVEGMEAATAKVIAEIEENSQFRSVNPSVRATFDAY